MNRFNKTIAALILLGACSLFGHQQETVLAQNAGVRMADTWSGMSESVMCSAPAVGTTTAVVFTAVTGKVFNVRAIQSIRLSSAGTVSFTNGSGGTVLAQYYLAANTPFQIPENEMGIGFSTTSGTGLNALADVAATLTITARVQQK